MVRAYRPSSLEDALHILENEECTVFAGGTDLMVKRKNWSGLVPRFEKPTVFIGDLRELREINIKDNFLIIGAACTFTQIMEYGNLPYILYEALEQMASPSIRNLATLGGNICNASPAGDSLPLLYAMDATLILQSFKGTKEIPIAEFIKGPGKTVINAKEILTLIKIPLKNFNKTFYKKIGTRKSTALSKLSFVGMLEVEGEFIKDVRLSFGAVGPTVVRSREIEKEIISSSQRGTLDIKVIQDRYSKLIKPISDQRSSAQYRSLVSLRLLEDFLANK